MRKKIISIFFSFLLLALFFIKSFDNVIYAESIDNLVSDYFNSELVEELYPADEIYDVEVAALPAAAAALGPLIADYAVPVFATAFSIFMIGLSAHDSDSMPFPVTQRILNGLDTYSATMKEFFYPKLLEEAHPATIAYLVLAGAMGTDAEAEAEDALEESGWSPQFIAGVKDDIRNSGTDPDPGGNIDIDKLIKYGVITLFSSELIRSVYQKITSLFPGMENSDVTGIFGPITKTGATDYYRWCDLPIGSNPKYATSNSFRMRYAEDLNMDLVQNVTITMDQVRLYNYGWDGVVYSQLYLLQSITTGAEYIFKVAIGKALSPQQYIDLEWDGIAFGFYKLLPNTMEIDTSATENCYQSSLDTERLSMSNFVPHVGVNLYNWNLANRVGFSYLREIAQTALGADLFSQHVAEYDFSHNSAYNPRVVPFCDFSKAVPGTYDNEWKVADLDYSIPDFGFTGEFSVVFPNTIPTADIPVGDRSTSSVLGNQGIFNRRVATSYNPGTYVANPFETSIPIGRVFTGDAADVSTETVDVDSLPTPTDLDLSYPKSDIGNPAIPETPSITENPSIPGTESPAIPDFGPIPRVTINIEPLTTCFANFTTKFPFSLPWDFQRIVDSFGDVGGSQNAPIFEFSILGNTITLDFNMLNPWAQIIRGFTYTEFVIGLVFIVRKLTP